MPVARSSAMAYGQREEADVVIQLVGDSNPSAAAASATRSSRSAIPMESQLLSVGAGVVVFVALLAFLATIHNRRKRRHSSASRDFKSPLIQHPHLSGSLKSNGSAKRIPGSNTKNLYPMPPPYQRSPPHSQLHSPCGSESSSTTSSSNGSSPQCTPITPYSSFSIAAKAMPPRGASAATMRVERPQFTGLDSNRGNVSLQLQYDAANQALQVTILACHDLPEVMGSRPAENGCTSQSNLNPYVKMRILPDNQHRVKTRVLRGTRNPVYDETFTMYGVSEASIHSYSLYLAVLAFDPYSRDLILGEAVYNLAGANADFVNNNNNQKLTTTLKLKARRGSVGQEQNGTGADGQLGAQRGQVLLSMAHNAHSNSVNMAVLKMKNLPKDEAIGLMDPYVKIYMLANGQRVSKQKTHVKKKTQEPIFNESFCFELRQRRGSSPGQTAAAISLKDVTFQVLVMNHDGVTRNEVIGQCTLDSNSPLMQQIMGAPGRQIAEWHDIMG